MKQYLVSENDVKKALGLNDFRNISKEKIMEFVNLIPNMDKDVALAIVNQFPVYKEFAVTVITVLKDMCNSALEKNDLSQKESLSAYRKILDDLGELLKKDGVSQEDQELIFDKMVMIADKIALKDTENKNFIAGVVKYGTPVLGAAIIIGAAILGVNIKGKDIPLLK